MKIASLIFTLFVSALMLIWSYNNLDSIVKGFRGISLWQVAGSFFLVALGIMLLRRTWSRVLSGFGYELSRQDASKVFYIGQLGKYLPGSMWSIAAQATLARKYNIPVRTTAAVGLLLVYLLLISSFALLGFLSAIQKFSIVQELVFLPLLLLAISVVGAHPRILSTIAKLLAGSPFSFEKPWSAIAQLHTSLLLVWTLFGLSIFLLVPIHDANQILDSLGVSIFYFSLAFVSGILLPFAPAGIGVREGILIAGLSLEFGIDVAVSTALLARFIHTVADLLFASYTSFSNLKSWQRQKDD
jgi:uncharacterized membrane protein YbhN (UPF0104 family)